MTAPSVVQFKTNNVSGTTVTVTMDAAPTDGNLLLFYGVHGTGSANSLTGSGSAAGFAEDFAGNNSEQNMVVGSKIASGENGEFAFSWTTNNEAAFGVVEITGNHAVLATAKNDTDSQVQTSTAIDITATVITTADDCLLVLFTSRDTAAGTETVSWSDALAEIYDENVTSTFLVNAAASEAVTAQDTYARTATYSATNRRNAAFMFAIAPAAGAGGAANPRPSTMPLLGMG